MGIKVSVIVPVYNVEKYLRKCLDSIIGQTLKDIEIIVVNDGSCDSSLSICEEYAQKDIRIKLISKENAGIAHTRNVGLKTATGEYISFVDSDDYIEENMLKTLYDLGQKTSSDMIFCNNDVVSYDLFKCKKYPFPTDKIIYAPDIEANIDYFRDGDIVSVWRKIFRRDFLLENNIIFDETLKFNEDRPFTIHCLEKAHSICGTEEILYHYVIRENSLVNTYFLKVLDMFCNMNREILENHEKMLREEFEEYIYRYFCSMKNHPYKKMTKEEKVTIIRIVRETDFIDFFLAKCPRLLHYISRKNFWTFYFLKFIIFYFLFKFRCYNILSYIIK